MKEKINALTDRARTNWKSGLTVSLVSLPLSVSLAVASNATPTMGIITAIWAGFFAAFFGGSHYNIVGPTGALSGILAVFAISHGAGALPMLAIITALIILVSWMFKLERFIKYIPEFTVEGFTVGVALTIAATQLGGALGIVLPSDVTEQFAKIEYFFGHLGLTQPGTFFVFTFFLAALFILKKVTRFPGAIILSPIGIYLGYLSQTGSLSFSLKTLGAVYPTLTPKLFEMATFVWDTSFIIPAIGVALIAIIETGISATIADNITGTKHDGSKEVLGLGIANLVAGLAGGIPGTAALARTSLNIKSGADNKSSAMINAVCIILISFVFLSYFVYIPMAVIASILMFTAYQLVQKEPLIHMWKHNRTDIYLVALVAAICIYKDTIYGIGIGVLIGVALHLTKKIAAKK